MDFLKHKILHIDNKISLNVFYQFLGYPKIKRKATRFTNPTKGIFERAQ